MFVKSSNTSINIFRNFSLNNVFRFPLKLGSTWSRCSRSPWRWISLCRDSDRISSQRGSYSDCDGWWYNPLLEFSEKNSGCRSLSQVSTRKVKVTDNVIFFLTINLTYFVSFCLNTFSFCLPLHQQYHIYSPSGGQQMALCRHWEGQHSHCSHGFVYSEWLYHPLEQSCWAVSIFFFF